MLRVVKIYLDEDVKPNNQPHFQFGIDLIIEIVIDDFVDIFKTSSSNVVHKGDEVCIPKLEYEVWKKVEDSQTTNVERNPLIMQEVPESKK